MAREKELEGALEKLRGTLTLLDTALQRQEYDRVLGCRTTGSTCLNLTLWT
jgi:hypothetical protein